MAYDINIDNHHDKNSQSQLPVFSKFNKREMHINHIKKILKELGYAYAKLINQCKFKYQLTF